MWLLITWLKLSFTTTTPPHTALRRVIKCICGAMVGNAKISSLIVFRVAQIEIGGLITHTFFTSIVCVYTHDMRFEALKAH